MNRGYWYKKGENDMVFGEDYTTVENTLKRFDITTNKFPFAPGLSERLNKAGFDNLYDIVENMNGALEAVGTDEEYMVIFRKCICFYLEAYGILPAEFDRQYALEENTINMIKERYKKNTFKHFR